MKFKRARLLMGPATRVFGNTDSAISTERRKKIRIYDPIPIDVKGTDSSGNSYRFTAIARNIGPGGLCAYTPHAMETGETLTVRIRFAHAGSTTHEAPTIEASATVIRAEKQFNDSYLFAASFLFYRFLYQ